MSPLRRHQIAASLAGESSLSEAEWHRRHRLILWLVWLHIGAITPFLILAHAPLEHAPGILVGMVLPAAIASTTVWSRLSLTSGLVRTIRASAATAALLGSSLGLVHLTRGMIETHFHFFIVVALIAFYHQWSPFVVSTVYVLISHGLLGTLNPEVIYNHPEAIEAPWVWAGIHGLFIAAASVISVIGWKMNESSRARLEESQAEYMALAESLHEIVYKTRVSLIDGSADFTYISPQLTDIMGYTPDELHDNPRLLFEQTHPDDIAALTEQLVPSPAGGEQPIEFVARMRDKATGEYHTWENRGLLITDPSKPYFELHIAARDVTESRRLNEQIQHHSLHDPVTGLPNRALVMDRLMNALVGVSRMKGHVGVFFIDIARFSLINESLGHVVGDKALTDFGQRVKSALRPGDTVGRIGGDEFIVVCGLIDGEEEAMRLAGRINGALDKPFLLGGKEVSLNASIGIVVGSSGDTAEDLFDRAAIAKRTAKDAGGSDPVVNRSPETLKETDPLDLGQELRRAISAGELVLHYQPIVDLRTGKITSVEALVRWRHPTRGLLNPGEFLPLASQVALGEQVDRWVIQAAAAQVIAWQAHDLFIDVAVNVSASLFLSPHLVDIVMDCLHLTGLDPTRLELEIPESLTSHDPELVASRITMLHAMGVSLSVDDFGAGQSFLTYLKRFPIDKLKLDSTFVQRVTHSPEDALIVRGVIDLAHSLGMGVVAEGVDDLDQLAFLRTHGADEVQGYLLSEPAPPEDAEKMLALGDPFAALLKTRADAFDTPIWDSTLTSRFGPAMLDTPTADQPAALSILVVDDDASAREIIVGTLTTEGFACIEAASGEEALELIDTYHPNAVLLDLSMNGMGGREVLTSIRSDLTRSAVPVLVVSGFNDAESRIWTLNNGADDFIAKPFHPRELAARVARAVRRSNA